MSVPTLTRGMWMSVHTVLSCICKKKYLFHFYFWLDLVATLSLFLDIPETYEILTGIAEQDSTQDLTDASGGGGGANMGNSAALARAGRISRAGTRAGRIARLIRLARCASPRLSQCLPG